MVGFIFILFFLIVFNPPKHEARIRCFLGKWRAGEVCACCSKMWFFHYAWSASRWCMLMLEPGGNLQRQISSVGPQLSSIFPVFSAWLCIVSERSFLSLRSSSSK